MIVKYYAKKKLLVFALLYKKTILLTLTVLLRPTPHIIAIIFVKNIQKKKK